MLWLGKGSPSQGMVVSGLGKEGEGPGALPGQRVSHPGEIDGLTGVRGNNMKEE